MGVLAGRSPPAPAFRLEELACTTLRASLGRRSRRGAHRGTTSSSLAIYGSKSRLVFYGLAAPSGPSYRRRLLKLCQDMVVVLEHRV